ncbi:hypothetical protein [Bradyrhizobium sp. SZCCHNRI3037]|uniref:hypothetical protein n=1 Tax=Bradyrhizobium sp. SZCCHNRI3037 TaxID=3057290 RepID=UPI002915F276|nr:hypothetical protein [Bradyrhizobium sp. SZCCHNRI3037]
MGAVKLGPTALIFDWERSFAILAEMEFDHVGGTGGVETSAAERKRADTPDVPLISLIVLMHHIMQHVVFGRELVLDHTR